MPSFPIPLEFKSSIIKHFWLKNMVLNASYVKCRKYNPWPMNDDHSILVTLWPMHRTRILEQHVLAQWYHMRPIVIHSDTTARIKITTIIKSIQLTMIQIVWPDIGSQLDQVSIITNFFFITNSFRNMKIISLKTASNIPDTAGR